jgi:hypothetical protein
MKALIVILTAIIFSSQSFAQTLSVRCKFSDGQATDFDKGVPRAVKTNDMSELVFDQIDTKKGTARLIGNQGAGTIQVFRGMESIHLIEATESGNMNITTIYVSTKIKNQSSFPVVHSRHTNTYTGPLPSQYVGVCSKLL